MIPLFLIVKHTDSKYRDVLVSRNTGDCAETGVKYGHQHELSVESVLSIKDLKKNNKKKTQKQKPYTHWLGHFSSISWFRNV